MPPLTPDQISAIDAAHIWHPYSRIASGSESHADPDSMPPMVAVAARGSSLTVVDGGQPVEVIDAMSSWWTAIHGHGHPVLDAAVSRQLATMNHVMFGGLTHEPAARLAELLVQITPTAWTPSSSAIRARWRSRWPRRWPCSSNAAAASPPSTG